MATFQMRWATALTGGGEGALDAINGNLLLDKYGAIVAVGGDKYYFYTLDEDSGLAESSPDVIAPDANAGLKRWILTEVFGAGTQGDTGSQSIP